MTLQARTSSFKAETIRVFENTNTQPLHIFHTMNVLVRRPDRLALQVTGDDGAAKLLNDGKTRTVFDADKNTYATVPAPGNFQEMMKEVVARYNIDFPLADFVVDHYGGAYYHPAYYGGALASGVVAGAVVGAAATSAAAAAAAPYYYPSPYYFLLHIEAGGQFRSERLPLVLGPRRHARAFGPACLRHARPCP